MFRLHLPMPVRTVVCGALFCLAGALVVAPVSSSADEGAQPDAAGSVTNSLSGYIIAVG
jgi:hypothetical protein